MRDFEKIDVKFKHRDLLGVTSALDRLGGLDRALQLASAEKVKDRMRGHILLSYHARLNVDLRNAEQVRFIESEARKLSDGSENWISMLISLSRYVAEVESD